MSWIFNYLTIDLLAKDYVLLGNKLLSTDEVITDSEGFARALRVVYTEADPGEFTFTLQVILKNTRESLRSPRTTFLKTVVEPNLNI